MGRKWRRWAIGLIGWFVSPALAWGAMTAAGAGMWAALAGLPEVFVAIAFLAALTVGVALAHYALSLRDHLSTHKSPPTAQPEGPSVATPTFVAVEGEISLAAEEAAEMTKTLHREWPYITPDGILIETALPDWRAKTTDFIGATLGSAQCAAFKSSGTGDNVLERLESEGKFLCSVAQKLTPGSVRANEPEVLEARRKRRGHQATSFLTYDHSRAPGAPAKPPSEMLADLFKEGDDLRLGCVTLPEGTPREQMAWRLGQPPQEQCGREDQARAWDQRVADYLWAEPDLKQFAPGWQAAGEPIGKSPDHPDQSMMNPDRLATWYEGKLDYLRGVIERSGRMTNLESEV